VRRSVVFVALATLAALAHAGACKRERTAPPATTVTTPDPRLQAAFTDIFVGATAAATKARELRESDLLSATQLAD
jgi:hypothetical protein